LVLDLVRVGAASDRDAAQTCGRYRNTHGDGPGGAFSNWINRSTAGSSPTTPERWPFRPPASLAFWSAPNEISPGPISTRCPSMDSMNQRPDRGRIHCGFGFSCHSPTQPAGSTVIITVTSALVLCPCHCGCAGALMDC